MQIVTLLNNNFQAIVLHFMFSHTYKSDDYDTTFPHVRISLLPKRTTTKSHLQKKSENEGQDSEVRLPHFDDNKPTVINVDNFRGIIFFRGIIRVVLFAACALRYFTSDDTTSLLHDIKHCTHHGVGDITKDNVADKTTVKNTGSDQGEGMSYLTTEQRDVQLDGIKQSVSISTTIESNASLLRMRLATIQNLPATPLQSVLPFISWDALLLSLQDTTTH